MAMLRILSTTCFFFGIVIFGGEIFAPDFYEGSFLTEAFLFIVGGVVLEALDRIVSSLAGIHRQLKKINGSENNEVQEPTVTKKKFNMDWKGKQRDS